jgi:hypothetical protein
MKRAVILATVLVLVGLATVALAGPSKAYAKPSETVWDEAVKAVRDVQYYVSDSNRDEGWFIFHTRRKGGHQIKVTVSGTASTTTVSLAAVDPDDEEDALDHMVEYLAALDHRLD